MKVKVANMNEIIHVNKSAWIRDIEKLIAEYKDYEQSDFCAEPETKAFVYGSLKELEDILKAVKSDTLTRQMFERIIYHYS